MAWARRAKRAPSLTLRLRRESAKAVSRTLRQPGLEVVPGPADVEHLDGMLLELVLVEIDDLLPQSEGLELGARVELRIDRAQHRPGQGRADHRIAMAADQHDG